MARNGGPTAFDIDGDLIRKLAGLLDETGLAEIEYAEGERRIRVTRAMAPPAAAPTTVAITTTQAGPTPVPEAVGPPAGAVTSPMVGTAYLAPEPGAPHFIKAGDRVIEGQTLLIIEAMKVMNPIRCPRAGTVTVILVQDGQPVEFGEPLLVIE